MDASGPVNVYFTEESIMNWNFDLNVDVGEDAAPSPSFTTSSAFLATAAGSNSNFLSLDLEEEELVLQQGQCCDDGYVPGTMVRTLEPLSYDPTAEGPSTEGGTAQAEVIDKATLLEDSARAFNLMIKNNNLTTEQVLELKKARRKAKNALAARNRRHLAQGTTVQLRQTVVELSSYVNQLRKENAELKARLLKQ